MRRGKLVEWSAMNMETEDLPGGVTKVALAGVFDMAGAHAIDQKFNTVMGTRRAVVVDLAQVTFIASMGLRTLITGAKTVSAKHGKLVLAAPAPEVAKVLEASGTDTLIPVLPDLSAALAAVRG